MGLQFRKSKKIGPVRLNFSKKGVGISTGIKGFRISKGANGKTRTTISIPGTGIRYTNTGGPARRTKNIKAKGNTGKVWLWIFFWWVLIPIYVIKFLINKATEKKDILKQNNIES